jgi:hypothetical protein
MKIIDFNEGPHDDGFRDEEVYSPHLEPLGPAFYELCMDAASEDNINREVRPLDDTGNHYAAQVGPPGVFGGHTLPTHETVVARIARDHPAADLTTLHLADSCWHRYLAVFGQHGGYYPDDESRDVAKARMLLHAACLLWLCISPIATPEEIDAVVHAINLHQYDMERGNCEQCDHRDHQ